MPGLVSYRLQDAVATITLDDGKLNVLSVAMLRELNAALDRAVSDRAVVVLTGRDGVLSAGFDLKVLKAGGAEACELLRAGFELAERVLSFATPVLVACPGHAVAMGFFLLLSADYRIGTAGAYKFTANEVAIGMTIPRAAAEICRQRLSPAQLGRALLLSEVYTPETAVAAGVLDSVVPSAELQEAAAKLAAALTKLDLHAHAASKLRVRAQALAALRSAIEADQVEFQAQRAAAAASH